jgi:hypothetical protein
MARLSGRRVFSVSNRPLIRGAFDDLLSARTGTGWMPRLFCPPDPITMPTRPLSPGSFLNRQPHSSRLWVATPRACVGRNRSPAGEAAQRPFVGLATATVLWSSRSKRHAPAKFRRRVAQETRKETGQGERPATPKPLPTGISRGLSPNEIQPVFLPNGT